MGDALQNMAGIMGAFAIALWVSKSIFIGVRRGDMKGWDRATVWEEDDEEEWED